MSKSSPLAAKRPVARDEPTGQELGELFSVVEHRTGVDLREHRRPVLARRAALRVSASGASSTEEYLSRLRDDLAEPWRLLERLTIKVSRFFRDPAAFELLRACGVPELRARRGAGELRAWSAGCAHGQEAYGLAMLLAGSGGPWSVLATDVDRSALTRARAGRYPRAEVEHVPGDLALEHFAPCGADDVRVAPALARGVRFTAHDLAGPAAPPGGPFDLVACRNVLIYFLPSSQAAVLGYLVDRITPGGWLLLGEAEWPPEAVERRLEVVDRPLRIFRVKPADPGSGT